MATKAIAQGPNCTQFAQRCRKTRLCVLAACNTLAQPTVIFGLKRLPTTDSDRSPRSERDIDPVRQCQYRCDTYAVVQQPLPFNGPAGSTHAPPTRNARSVDRRRRPRLRTRFRAAWLSDGEPRNRLDRRRKGAGRGPYSDLRGHARHGHLCGVGAGRGRP